MSCGLRPIEKAPDPADSLSGTEQLLSSAWTGIFSRMDRQFLRHGQAHAPEQTNFSPQIETLFGMDTHFLPHGHAQAPEQTNFSPLIETLFGVEILFSMDTHRLPHGHTQAPEQTSTLSRSLFGQHQYKKTDPLTQVRSTGLADSNYLSFRMRIAASRIAVSSSVTTPPSGPCSK